MQQTPQEADNLCKVTAFVASERNETSKVQAGYVHKRAQAKSHQATTYLWLESERLRSLLQNFHCFIVGNPARVKK